MRRFSFLLILVFTTALFAGCQDATVPTADPVADFDVMYVIGISDDTLTILDREGGQGTEVGRLDPDPRLFVSPSSMAIRPCDGSIYIWNNSHYGDEPNTSIVHGSLLTVDPCTGIGTEVGPELASQGQIGALAFHPDGRLFGAGRVLFEIDPESGVVTEIGSLGVRLGGADFDPQTGILYGVEMSAPYRFGTIDLESGEFTLIGNLDLGGGAAHCLVFDPADNTLYGSSSYYVTRFFKIDPETAAIQDKKSLGVGISGMGFAPDCGAPVGDCRDRTEWPSFR